MKRSFFQYVSLNVLGALGLSGYILADTLFVAHRLGTDGLAALNLAISVFGLINGLGLMLGIGGASRYAIYRTQGDGVRADRAFSRALACGGALGGLLALAGLLWAVPLARLLGAEGAILPMCSVYLRTVLLFAPCFLLNHILTAFVRNDGNPKLAMAAMLLGSLSNIVLDYVFLYPMDMGIFGAALATGMKAIVAEEKAKPALYDFVSDDGIRHRVWKFNDPAQTEAIEAAFAAIPATYIADGHHRAASAVKVGLKRRAENPGYTGEEPFNYFLSVLFPDEELMILPYNRVVKDLNGLSREQFFEAVKEKFELEEIGKEPYAPAEKGTFGMPSASVPPLSSAHSCRR